MVLITRVVVAAEYSGGKRIICGFLLEVIFYRGRPLNYYGWGPQILLAPP
jgi:hypothetical protein